MTDTSLMMTICHQHLAGWNLARIYYFTMTQLDIAVGVSRVHDADILLDLASCMFSSSLFMSQTSFFSTS